MIGMMSGTSLDGLDIAHCTFSLTNNGWTYSIDKAVTLSYPIDLREELNTAHTLNSEGLITLDHRFAGFCAHAAREFIMANKLNPIAIASHGHTVFHRPDRGMTLQIGSGATIAAISGIATICDFRSQDVALGGQGAPLVPIGDQELFKEYDLCLNIGGFSNISAIVGGQRRAWDICPANFILNRLSQQLGKAFDEDGKLAASGNLITTLLEELEALDYYRLSAPKSLGREWVDANFSPLLSKYSDHEISDLLRTFTEHIAMRISQTANDTEGNQRMLASGGGALNLFLTQRIQDMMKGELVIADPMLMQFKEAMIFAFLGVLRLRNEPNCLASVTGAAFDHCSGAIYNGSSSNVNQ
jgi:anhydro-N-acetylmuramic acid kinase